MCRSNRQLNNRLGVGCIEIQLSGGARRLSVDTKCEYSGNVSSTVIANYICRVERCV